VRLNYRRWRLGHDAVALELAYVTAFYAALAPFGKFAVLLSEPLPDQWRAERGHGPRQDAAGGREDHAPVRQRERRQLASWWLGSMAVC
jgi:hypothetical protein